MLQGAVENLGAYLISFPSPRHNTALCSGTNAYPLFQDSLQEEVNPVLATPVLQERKPSVVMRFYLDQI